MKTDEAVRRLTEVIMHKHLSLATGRSYCAWLRRYCDYIKGLPSHLSSEQKLERFLTHPAKRMSPPAGKIKRLIQSYFSTKRPCARSRMRLQTDELPGA
jgi:hypothetical protein